MHACSMVELRNSLALSRLHLQCSGSVCYSFSSGLKIISEAHLKSYYVLPILIYWNLIFQYQKVSEWKFWFQKSRRRRNVMCACFLIAYKCYLSISSRITLEKKSYLSRSHISFLIHNPVILSLTAYVTFLWSIKLDIFLLWLLRTFSLMNSDVLLQRSTFNNYIFVIFI